MSRLGSHYNRYAPQTFTEANGHEFRNNNYGDVYQPHANEQLSVTNNEANIEYTKVCNYVTVSSRDRNVSRHPDVSHYTVQFPSELRNVHSIQLIQAIIPDKNNVTLEPYLLLKIDEIEDVMMAQDKNVSDSFAILQLAPATVPGSFIQLDKRIHEHTIKVYKTPKAGLTQLTINVLDVDGNRFDFGCDPSDPLNKSTQNTFVFRVVCLEKKRTALSQRNVF
jgi:hypothetical protein